MSERNESAEQPETGQVRPVSGDHHVVLRHTLRVLLGIALVLYFIAAGLLVGLRYGLLPRVDAFRPRIEALGLRENPRTTHDRQTRAALDRLPARVSTSPIWRFATATARSG